MTRHRETARVWGAIALCLMTFGCGGNSSPTSPSASGSSGATGSTGGTGTGGGGTSSTSCRTGLATYRIVTTGGGFTSTTNGSCSFNNATVEGTCTNDYSDSLGTTIRSVSVTRHASRGDVVDEVSVIPPRNLSLGTTTTVTGSTAAVNSTGTSTLTYDGQRRLVSINAVSQGSSGQSTSTTTYTAWDASGRPTAGTTVSGSQTTPVNFTYDNNARTQASTTAGVTCTQTFDQNGNPTVAVCSNGVTSTTTVLSTLQVCR